MTFYEGIKLADALRNSTLPFLIEAHDWGRLPPSFQEEIKRNYAVLISERYDNV